MPAVREKRVLPQMGAFPECVCALARPDLFEMRPRLARCAIPAFFAAESRVVTGIGRANVVIAGALLAFDATSIAICTCRDK